jgi:hypothetical protein
MAAPDLVGPMARYSLVFDALSPLVRDARGGGLNRAATLPELVARAVELL